ncbi:MAG: TolC family protein [Bacteroidales bacterium]|nr:TolC family protein [Bacteroidales bacterium]
MRTITFYLIFSILFLINNILSAQTKSKFTLNEAQEYGLENNHDIKNALTDIKIAKNKVKETISIGLPQVNGTISTTNYIDIPTTLMPDFISPAIFRVNESNFGLTPTQPLGDIQYFPVSFGTEFNASADVSVNQLIFNGDYIVGLQSANSYLQTTRLQHQKTEIDLKESIANAYFIVLATERNAKILGKTLNELEKMLYETNELFKAGFVEDTDIVQLELMVSDLKASLITIKKQLDIAYLYLKFNMGFDLNEDIILSEDLNSLVKKAESNLLLETGFELSQNIDFKIFISQKELANKELMLEKAAYLPTISAFFNATTNAMRSEFNFFDSDKTWYPSTIWGVQMQIPIFSSGKRSSRVQQAKLKLKKTNELQLKIKEGLRLEEKQTRADLNNAFLIYKNKIKSLGNAKKIYNKIETKFLEGMASSMELLQSHNQYLSSEGNYIKAVLDLLNAKQRMIKLMNE